MPTPKQIAVLHVAKKQLGLDDEKYWQVLQYYGGVDTAKELDQLGFEAAMNVLNSWGFRSEWTKKTFGDRPGRATPRQIGLIRHLWREWSGAEDTSALDRWLERSYRVSALRFLTPAQASMAIDGLRAMVRRKETAA